MLKSSNDSQPTTVRKFFDLSFPHTYVIPFKCPEYLSFPSDLQYKYSSPLLYRPDKRGKVHRTFAPSDEAHSGRYFRQEPRKSYRPTNTARGWYIISSIWSNGQHRWSRTPQLIRGHHRGQNTSKVFHHFSLSVHSSLALFLFVLTHSPKA